jgi:hypothetical protein
MDLTGILLTLGTSLLLTLAVELSFALLLGVRGRSAILLVALANLATNPVVVYTYIVVRMFVGRGQADELMLFLEIGAVFLEALLYANTPGMMDPEKLFYGVFSVSRNESLFDYRLPGKQTATREKKRRAFSGGTAALLLSVLLNTASFLMGKLVNSL